MLSALLAEEVEFLIVGAYAMAAHGLPRSTGDIDIWVRPTPENAERVLRALASFGAPLFDLTAADLVQPTTVFQIGVVPQRIDILAGISAVTFDEAWPRRLQTQLGGLPLAVISLDDLIHNKRATGRVKDLADAEVLEEIRRGGPGATR